MLLICSVALFNALPPPCVASDPRAGQQAHNAKVDFGLDVLAAMTQAGCNSGACHGAAAGRGGLQLSLYGQSPTQDYAAIALMHAGRRVHSRDPDRSLVLRKPLGELDHGGGQLLEPGQPAWQAIRQWIAAGAEPPLNLKLRGLTLEPPRLLLQAAPGEPLPTGRVNVWAELGNGQRRLVNPLVLIEPNDPERLSIARRDDGVEIVLQPLASGQQLALVRYRDQVAPLELVVRTVPGPDSIGLLPPAPASRAEPVAEQLAGPTSNIDAFILQKLDELGLQPANRVDDSVLVRRLYLSLTGRLPTAEQAQRFIDSTSPNKQIELIDQLLASPAANHYWTFRLLQELRAEQLVRRRSSQNESTAVAYRQLVSQHLRASPRLMPLLEQLLLAGGEHAADGGTGFLLSEQGARQRGELFSEVFLGVRLRCANCHNHPLDRWTQDDYHGLASVFSGLESGPGVVGLKWRPGELNTHPESGLPVPPRLPGGLLLDPSQDPRPRLWGWLVDDVDQTGDPVGRNWANRLWRTVLGRGLVEPVDDHRSTNPATHPELLSWVTNDWRQHDYDLWYLIRQFSHTQLFSRLPLTDSGAAESKWYVGRSEQSLPLPVLADLFEALLGDAPAAGTAVSNYPFSDQSSQLLALAGCPEPTDCRVPDSSASDLSHHLRLLGGPALNGPLQSPNGWLARQKPGETDNQADDVAWWKVAERFYLRCFGTEVPPPLQQRWTEELTQLKTPGERAAWLEDVAWSLLASERFGRN